MSDPIRVLIVDDSSIIRRSVSNALANTPGILVAGTAGNGKIAMDQIPLLKPDVIILDIEMPEADGFEVLKFLRRNHPGIRTIMFSTLTQRGAVQTIEALSLGASDYSSKPENTGQQGYGEVIKQVAADLIPKINQFRPRVTRATPGTASEVKKFIPFRVTVPKLNNVVPRVVAIGTSTGGPDALSRVLPALKQALPVPILIVQHMPPLFTKILADRLSVKSNFDVFEGSDGMEVLPGTAYIAPGDFHMTLVKKGEKIFISLNQDLPENSCRPAVDVLFRSVGKIYGPKALGVIMTGMGQDGFVGAKAMKAEGATVFAQDEASSVVWGMPSFIVREGLADQVLPLDQMSSAIEECVLRKLTV
jgi:two-component system chemotaxis response regulator CheB